MVTKYLRAAMRGAKYELLEEGGYYGSIPGFDGVWADAACLEDCRDELEEVVQEWLLFRLSRQLPVPIAANRTDPAPGFHILSSANGI